MDSIDKYIAEHKLSLTKAVVAYLIKDNNVILGLRKKVMHGLGENIISGIGGKVGDIEGLEGETFEEALSRELKEEIDVEVRDFLKIGEITCIYPNKPNWNQYIEAYLVSDWDGEPRETEYIRPLEFSIDELPIEKMWEDNTHTVPLMVSGIRIKAKFLYSGSTNLIQDMNIQKDVVF